MDIENAKDQEQIREILRQLCGKNAKAWAESNAFSPSYIYDVLKGAKPPSERLAKALGHKRAIVFIPIAADPQKTAQAVTV